MQRRIRHRLQPRVCRIRRLSLKDQITYRRTFVKPVKAAATVTAFSSAAHRSLFHGVCLADPMQHTDVPTSVRREDEDRRKKTQRTRAQLLFIARMRRDARSLLLLRFGLTRSRVAFVHRSEELGSERRVGGSFFQEERRFKPHPPQT